jgi:hypothetical protein
MIVFGKAPAWGFSHLAEGDAMKTLSRLRGWFAAGCWSLQPRPRRYNGKAWHRALPVFGHNPGEGWKRHSGPYNNAACRND